MFQCAEEKGTKPSLLAIARAHTRESRSSQRKSPGSNPARPRRNILVCVRRNRAGANKFGTVPTAR
jgi:hypothetical protein